MGKPYRHITKNSSGIKKLITLKIPVLLCLVTSLLFIPVIVVNASVLPETNEITEKKIRERVFKEALSGNMTNDADVIKVALAQYEERKSRKSELS